MVCVSKAYLGVPGTRYILVTSLVNLMLIYWNRSGCWTTVTLLIVYRSYEYSWFRVFNLSHLGVQYHRLRILHSLHKAAKLLRILPRECLEFFSSLLVRSFVVVIMLSYNKMSKNRLWLLIWSLCCDCSM